MDTSTYLELKLKIKELENQLAFYRIILDNSFDCEIYRDMTGKVLYCSKSFERITGYSADDFINGIISEKDIVHPEDWEKVLMQMQNTARVVEPEIDFEFRIITKTGIVKELNLCSTPVLQNGTYHGFRSNLRDKTHSGLLQMI